MAWLDRIETRQLRRLGRSLPSPNQLAGIGHEAMSRAGDAAHHLADNARHQGVVLAREASHQGALIAREAGHQVQRAGRAMRADPLPAIVGIVGIALFVSLVSGRRR